MNNLPENRKDFILYTDANGNVKVEVFLQNETLWLTQKAMSELFGVGVPAIAKHLKNIFESGELNEKEVVSILEITTQHGAIKGKTQTNKVKFYNLDTIIAVGYRVNSRQATQFRIWATKVLREYIIKGFVLDDERLKQGSRIFGKDYFDELLERVRSIRASERRIYQKITDIFAECSIDYDKHSEITQEFYATVQNKFHYAITGQTAAEIIHTRADKTLPNMGLTTWKNAPKGRILKSDVSIAKNYLSVKEIKKLERTVSAYFDYIENQIEIRKENNRPFTMQELAESVNKFLNFNEFEVLKDKGNISHQQAIKKAEKEYDDFNKNQKIDSDFDEFVKKQLKKDEK
ncbi:MAG: virulence RhuM family protein [Bacteroidales bacterium]|nr:virulence RhuM family protein [Bacteroidales bacterium]